MKHLLLTAAVVFTATILFSGCNSYDQKASADLSSKTDSLSYSFGYLQGSSLSNEGITDIDMQNYVAGLQAGLDTSDTSIINNMAMQTLIQTYLQEMEMRRIQQQEEDAAEHIERGQAFLEENAQNPDVFETESGLQYRVLEEGDGESPVATDVVRVHYEGRLLSDEVFDSSYERGQPATFPLNRVIEGWTEGLQLMQEGAKYQFFIPSDLAYRNSPPQGSPIPPGAVLIFDVELLEVNPDPQQQ
ncbi:FKBP-type peptidyl-prolyl cis-trans isomerase [Rhodohalobacter sp. 614A]|uniref:FKBP-type peptidyl-prolyl cis-trans isomerase n=1 Tax=Rhodohalobacter sp. 614A TaxID=2908649 RepID=UPI001F42AAE8|nr:FKBP-type peptidyl-prolyl cis-trans isomerase [Rhodohalobacter sp. 614A]